MSFLAGYFYTDTKPVIAEKVITKTDTVTFRDTVYKFKAVQHIVRDTLYSVVYDTVNNVTHDTVYVVYSSPFKVGSDSLNCTGIVSFDIKRFYFNDIKFKYPNKTIYNTKVIIKPDWTYTAIASAIAFTLGVIIAK